MYMDTQYLNRRYTQDENWIHSIDIMTQHKKMVSYEFT